MLGIALLTTAKVQNYLAQKLTLPLEEILHTNVEIGNISIRNFHDIGIKNLYLEDQKGDTLLYIQDTEGHILLTPLLFNQTLYFTKLKVDNLKLHLDQDTLGNSNIQFIIDIINAQEKTEKPSELSLHFKEIRILNSSFSYQDSLSESINEAFNPHSIHVSNINAKLNGIVELEELNINAQIKALSFEEKCGLKLSNLQTQFELNDSTTLIPNFSLKLPNSSLSADSIVFNYNEINSLFSNKTKFQGKIAPSYIDPKDIKYFALSTLDRFQSSAYVQGNIHGTLNNIHTNNLKLSYGQSINIQGNIQAMGLPKIDETFFYTDIKGIDFDKKALEDVFSILANRPIHIPSKYNAIGMCHYSGNISGFLSNIVLFGKLRTDIGSINTDVSVRLDKTDFSKINIKGNLHSKNLKIQKLFPDSKIENVGFNFSSNLETYNESNFEANGKLQLTHITYKNYTYTNLELNGKLNPYAFEGKANMNDKNGKLNFVGNVNVMDSIMKFNFVSSIKDFNPYALQLSDNHKDLALNLNIKSHFQGTSWDKMNGRLSIDSILVSKNNTVWRLDSLVIDSRNVPNRMISINSKILEARLGGDYQLRKLPLSFQNLLNHYIPILVDETKTNRKTKANSLNAYIRLEPTNKLAAILDLSWHTNETAIFKGYYNDSTKQLKTDVKIPHINHNNRTFNNIFLHIDNDSLINCTITANTAFKKDSIFPELAIKIGKNKIHTHLLWDNHKDSLINAGEVLLITDFINDTIANKQGIRSRLMPTQVMILDSLWNIKESLLSTDFNKIKIDNFSFYKKNQSINLNGLLSTDLSDSINVQLDAFSLDYLSQFLPITHAIYFGGEVSGNISAKQVLKKPLVEGHLQSPNFHFNKSYLGQIDVNTKLNYETNSLEFKASISDTTNLILPTQIADVDGNFFYSNDSLDIKIKADGAPLGLVNYYTDSFFNKVDGKGYGSVHVYGNTHKGDIAVDVDAFVENGIIGIDFLKTEYHFNDSIHMDRSIIDFGTIEMYDNYGNKGTASGSISHNFFNNITLDIHADINKVNVLNTSYQDNPTFYGMAFATGKVDITGNENEVFIDCNAQTNKSSRIFIPLDSYFAEDQQFITFISPKNKNKSLIKLDQETHTSTILNVNALIDITSNAEANILINSKTGDALSAKGQGNLRLEYATGQDIKLYGMYEVTKGTYSFSFQNALMRTFNIQPGSRINWTGDIMNAQTDIQAYYKVTASLKDILDQDILANVGRSSVPVNCGIFITGPLTKPNIRYDISLPNSQEEIQRAVKVAVNTEEERTRQLISLLILGRFINPEIYNTQQSLFQSNDLLSVVSSTISSQLNMWASQMFDNWEFGLNFRSQGDGEDRNNEYELNFIYTPNPRISFNGSVGYRDNNIEQSSKFIGDFDLEYKLTRNGRFSAKAYTHTNDYREFKKGETTQGIGLIYRETFNNLADLWQQWQNKK